LTTRSAPSARAFSPFSSSPTVVMTGAADGLGHPDRRRADAGPAGVNQHGFPRLQPGVVEQHVLHGAEGDGRASRVGQGDALRNGDHEPGRHVDPLAAEPVEVEAP
jgi:hypothetical protein